MLPQNLIVDFWLKVQSRLEKDWDKEKSQKGISEYLALAEKHDFADMVYHREPDEIALTIAGGLAQQGFKDPSQDGSNVLSRARGRRGIKTKLKS
jgi:hypothetical protein